MNEIDEANIKWNEKENKCVWRGKLENGYDFNFFDKGDKLNMNQRKYFIELMIDNKFTNIDFVNSHTTIIKQCYFKYILDIDGFCNTWDASIWKLYSGSVLLKVKSTWQQWYYDELKEWVHYVPIENDFSDLNEKITWCINNDDKCKEISNNAKKFVIEKLNLDYVNNKITKSVLEYLSITNQ